MTLDELILEWSYRTTKGYPCLDNPSDIAILKTLLERLNLPSEEIIDELEDEKADEDLDVPGTSGMEDSPVEDEKAKDKKKDDYINSISCPYKRDIMKKVNQIFDREDIENDEKEKLVNRVCSFATYPPVKNLLKDKGYKAYELKEFSKEIQNLTEDIPDVDRQFFLEYIKDTKNQKTFKPTQRGNLFDDIKDTGIHPDIITLIVKHTTQDSGKKSVGMGELALAIMFENVGAAPAGKAGDLSLNGATFEIKGEGATLGKRPDAVNTINLDNIARFVEGENNLYMAKENKKSSLYYKGNKVNLNSFADVLADIYENTKDKEGFKKAFKEDLKAIETTKKELHAEAVDQYFSKISWDTPENIHKGLALLNAYRYILKEDFKHFLAHDFGAGKSNTGDYIYAEGTPEKIVNTLLDAGAKFEKISPANLKPRIGFTTSYRD